MGPDHGVILTVALTLACGQRGDARKLFLHDVQFVLRRLPILGHAFEDGVVHELFHRIIGLMIVFLAGDAEKIAPIIKGRRAVGVHRAMDHHRRHAGLVRFGDALHVSLVVGVGETFVVHHHVVALGPVGILVQRNHRLGAAAAFVDDLPVHFRVLRHAGDQCLTLEHIVVAATTGNQECLDGLLFVFGKQAQ